MNGVALFAGIAGLDIGINHIIPDSRTVCYVEGETYAAQVLHAKMLKGELPHAPIYSDVRTFPSVAHHFAQKVDFITAGFPCQPFSAAGTRKGTDDERWLWSSILEIIGEVGPSFLFLENVSNLLNEWGAFDEISKSLAKIGFNLEWGLVRASDVGANHQRNRLFIFGWKNGSLPKITLSNPNGERRPQPHASKIAIKKGFFGRENNEFSNPNGKRRKKNFKEIRRRKFDLIWEGVIITDPDHNRESIMSFRNEEGFFLQKPKSNFHPSWWRGKSPFSPVCRVDDGISNGMDRLRALGNAVVPLQASWAFYTLIHRAKSHPSKS